MSLSKSTRLFQRFDNNKQYFGDFCSKLPSRNSITDSEKSQSSQNESLSQTSSNLDRNFTYWSIHRSKKKTNAKATENYFSSSDIGALDPGLYLMSVSTTQKEFKLNIALKYTIIEDVLSVIIFKCTFKVRNLSNIC